MGLGPSNSLVSVSIENRDEREYIIPTWVESEFSPVQVADLMDLHVSYGVPFRIQDNGDSRPKGIVKEIVMMESFANLHRSSVEGTLDGKRNSSLRFRYDAKVPVLMSVSVAISSVGSSKSEPSPNSPRFKVKEKTNTATVFKMRLPSGFGRVWDSTKHLNYVSVKAGKPKRASRVLYSIFQDLVLTNAMFAQIDEDVASSTAVSERKRKKHQAQMKLRRNHIIITLKPCVEANEGETETETEPAVAGQLSAPKLSTVASESSEFVLSGMTTVAESNGGSEDDADNEGDSDGGDEDLTVSRTEPTEGALAEVKGAVKQLAFRCETQQIFLDGSALPYVTHVMYGVCHEKPPAPYTDADADTEVTVGAVKLSDSTAPNEDGDGDDSADCVICLCEPREFACLPCRHLSMCSSCVLDLTSHGNKCPICRRKTETFLKIPIALYNRKIAAETAAAASGDTRTGDES